MTRDHVVTERDGGTPTFADVNRDIGRTLAPPGDLYFTWMSVVGLVLVAGILAWTYQIWVGMGAAGKRTPQMWAMYITSFVFWIGIGHAGTLISAILYLFRAFYLSEVFTAWYSGDRFERASLFWRVTRTYAWALWLQYFCNSVAPLVLFWRRARTSPPVLYVVSILVLIGMWFERFNIIVPSLAHDFYPYTWGIYVPSPTDTTIVIASFAWFFLLFLGFIKLMPSVSIVEVKETLPHPVRDIAHGRRR